MFFQKLPSFILYLLLIDSLYGLSFTDSYTTFLRNSTIDDLIHNGKWVLFFNDVSFNKRTEMNMNIDYLSSKYDGHIHIGYIDCYSEHALCDRYSITTYPTIKYVINNVIHDYYGRRSLRSLTEMCNSLDVDPITFIETDEEYAAFTHSSSVVFLCVYDDTPEGLHLLETYKNVSQHLLLFAKFGATKRPLAALPPIHPPYILRNEEEEDVSYFMSSSRGENKNLLEWVKQRTLPLLPEYRGMAFNDIVQSGKVTLLFALNSSYLLNPNSFAKVKQIVRGLPISLKKQFSFAYLDGSQWIDYLGQYGINEKDISCAFAISERVSGLYYDPVEIEEEAIQHYLYGILNNSIGPVISSSVRYYFFRFLNSFSRLPFITKFFLSISFTLTLAIFTLQIIFRFTQPQEVVRKVVPKKEEKPRQGMRKRRNNK